MEPWKTSLNATPAASRRRPMESPSSRRSLPADVDLVCFCHLRWDFVYQRPQHLMSRFGKHRRVFFFEEPVLVDEPEPGLDIRHRGDSLWTVTPKIPRHVPHESWDEVQRSLVDELWQAQQIRTPALWYYTPMALGFSDHLSASIVVYDCMDELANFKGAPPKLYERERLLFERADVVFTGGHSLYEAKKTKHHNVHPFPSSVDVAHFARARQTQADPADQAPIASPRIGFFGVIDERMDIELLAAIADRRPDWQYVLLGPVVKIDPATLPRRANLHYLGGKSYAELPQYLSGWDVAMLPFALNESTRFISPTKTPEYLAAGCAVVSTPIRDVVNPYQTLGLVHIAETPDEFVTAIEAALADKANPRWIESVDAYLAKLSWDKTWQEMDQLMGEAGRDSTWVGQTA